MRRLIQNVLNVSKSSALEAGNLLIKKINSKRKITSKDNTSNNLVTDMDEISQDIIVNKIHRKFPDHHIIAEEKNYFLNLHSDYKWYIDPLDGTVNYVHRFPFFCVSIAFEIKNEIVVGVVYNPNLKELFWAIKGEGSYKNGKVIRVSKTKKLSNALLATGFPYDLKKTRANNINYFNTFIYKAQAIRRGGSAALDLCYTASGIFDGFWEIKLHPWDIAAGAIITKEAGGNVSNFSGDKLNLWEGKIVASNGLIHNEMIKVISEVR